MVFISSYKKILPKNLPHIKKFFKVDFLNSSFDNFPLLKFSQIISKNYSLLVIMAGCHGEEIAPPLSIFENYRLISAKAKKHKINLIIYPLVNPWGFFKNQRYNQEGLNCNRGWIHEKTKRAKEVKIILKDLKKIKPLIFASLHEDSELEKEFFLYSFGERKYENFLIGVGKKYFPILKDGQHEEVEVKNGVVFNDHDGSAEDFMYHWGCRFTCCAETPLKESLIKRKNCNRDLILKLIELTSKG